MERRMLCENCADPDVCLERFRAALENAQIEVTLDGHLATLPDNVHLHLRPFGERKGTLEYTLDRRLKTSWLSWHANRHQPWIDTLVPQLEAAMKAASPPDSEAQSPSSSSTATPRSKQ